MTAKKLIHRHTIDHHPTHTSYQRFNKKVAQLITQNVGTMTCFWLFCGLALVSLPAVLISGSIIILVAWVAQTLLQLVLLPALMVGQNLQNEAADSRAAKQFDDTELIVDRLDTSTQGGIKEILDAIEDLKPKRKRSSNTSLTKDKK